MAQPRLTTALTSGALTMPHGRVIVMRPPAAYDLTALADQPLVLHGFRPDADYWEAGGFETATSLPDATPAPAAIIVVVPRSKALARAMVAEATGKSALVIVDGQRSEGIDSLWRDLRDRLGDMPCVTKAHGRLMWFAGGDATAAKLADWVSAGPAPGPDGFFTQAGVFSEGGVDAGSALLLASLPPKLPARMADLGAGWGYLAHGVLAAHPEIATLDLIEAEALALDCARLNVTDPRARFHWADASAFAPQDRYDALLTNPPFHVSRAADPGLGRRFIAAAASLLVPHGTLWLVANRHLPYEQALKETFVTVEEVAGTPAFKVFRAARPVSASKTPLKSAAAATRHATRSRSRRR